MESNFYVYVHRRLTDNRPFYVGKGSGKRAWQFTGASRNTYWHRVRNKYGISVEIVFESLTEDEAFQCEKDTITELNYFGYSLTNLTTGGEGSSGINFTDQQRLNIAEGLINKRYAGRIKIKPEVKRQCTSGINNPFADKSDYDFVRLSDGLETRCSRHKLCEDYDLDKGLLKKLFYKVPRKSACGWKLKRINND
jgi:hypothetical protein